jgi:hypothetical protein
MAYANPQEMADLKHLAQQNSGLPILQDEQYNPDGTAFKYTLPDYISPAGAKFGDPSVDPSLYYVNPYYTNSDDLIAFTVSQKQIKLVPTGTTKYLKPRL